tara:strand:- start:122 stop:811 length:690 start_codon:yes stop_codon:yes gene_type:complete
MTDKFRASNIKKKIIIAIPKGRILKELDPILNSVNIVPEKSFYDNNNRKLMFLTSNKNIIIIVVRSFDVANFVAFGGAHLGVVGSDVLEEFSYNEIYAPVNLGIGKCRMSVAQPKNSLSFDSKINLSHLRVATKYPKITKNYFSDKGVQAECLKLNGALEIAPMLGLTKKIVDLVSTGKTLKENGLVEIEKIMDISSYLIANRNISKSRPNEINNIVEKFGKVVNVKNN